MSFPNFWSGLLFGVAADRPIFDTKLLPVFVLDVLIDMGDSGSVGLVKYGLWKNQIIRFELKRNEDQTRTGTNVKYAIGHLKLNN